MYLYSTSKFNLLVKDVGRKSIILRALRIFPKYVVQWMERRVAAIGDEYEDNAKTADIKFFGVNYGLGPFMNRLASPGPILVVAAGRFEQLLASGQAFVTTIAEARVNKCD